MHVVCFNLHGDDTLSKWMLTFWANSKRYLFLLCIRS